MKVAWHGMLIYQDERHYRRAKCHVTAYGFNASSAIRFILIYFSADDYVRFTIIDATTTQCYGASRSMSHLLLNAASRGRGLCHYMIVSP